MHPAPRPSPNPRPSPRALPSARLVPAKPAEDTGFAPLRLVRHLIRKPEYGVLYLGTAFWIIAGTVGIGRPLLDIFLAHV